MPTLVERTTEIENLWQDLVPFQVDMRQYGGSHPRAYFATEDSTQQGKLRVKTSRVKGMYYIVVFKESLKSERIKLKEGEVIIPGEIITRTEDPNFQKAVGLHHAALRHLNDKGY